MIQYSFYHTFILIQSQICVIHLLHLFYLICVSYPRLTIWPGYTTTILQYELSIMLCTDVSHKVLRSETVLDFMANLKQQCGHQRFPDICVKELVGLIVLTK